MRRALAIIILAALLICGGAAYAATGGGAGDPLVSLSFLRDTFVGDLFTRSRLKADVRLQEVYDEADARLAYLEPVAPEGASYAGKYTQLAFNSGGRVTLNQFASFVPTYGAFSASVEKGSLINMTDASEVFDSCALSIGTRYFAAEGSVVRITASADSLGLVDGYYDHSPSGSGQQSVFFIDLDGHWAKDSAMFMADRGYMNGVGNFRFAPNDDVTRAMFVTVLGRVAGIKPDSYKTSSFADVDMSSWYGPYVAWAASVGVVTGYDASTFAPNDPITREQMALILVRFMDAFSYRAPAANAPIEFTDAAVIDGWAADAVSRTQTMGIINGVADGAGFAFRPLDHANRGQMCAVVERMLRLSGRA
ncbi:MAG: S-layer homology domain-containing protein [Oscillospiraceae bacterium]|nr:S-layer homology domain-containing protein [Oscillospiraceae bacterium]MCR5648833.1 S-layer homology domain-containing protein [Oscillospiraceae bacterium]